VLSVQKRPGQTLALLLLLGLVIALYGRVVGYPFLQWDDPVYVTSRAPLHQLAHGQGDSPLLDLLSPRDALEGRFWEYYPFRDLSYAADARAGAMKPWTFHLTNLALHLLCTLLVYFLGRRLGLTPCGALVAGALMGLHPLAVEPVAWISARKDLLYSLCVLGALLCFARICRGQGSRGHGRAWIGFYVLALLALGSKGPGVVIIPLAGWLVLSLAPREDWPKLGLRLVPIALTAGVWIAFILHIGEQNRIIKPLAEGITHGGLFALGAPLRAMTTFLFPLQLSPSYGPWTGAWYQDPHVWGTLALVLMLVMLWRRGALALSPATLILVCLLIAVLPTSGLVGVQQERADRFLYLPLAFLSLLAGWGAGRLISFRAWLLAPLLLLMLALPIKAHLYLQAWSDDVTLWKHLYRQDPENTVACGSLGALAMEQGQLEVARPLLLKALAGAPEAAVSWTNVGLWWLFKAGPEKLQPGQGARSNYLAQAQHHLQRALKLDADRPAALNGMGQVAWLRGEASLAEKYYRKALHVPRATPAAAISLGDLLWDSGRKGEAVDTITRQLSRFPGTPPLAQWLEQHPL